MCAEVATIAKWNIVFERPRASRMSMLMAWSACTIPTQARIWMTGTAADPLVAQHERHEVGRDDDQAAERRDGHEGEQPRDARPGGGDPLRLVLDAREGGREDPLQRAAELAGRHQHRVVGDGVDAERGGAEEAADQEAVGVGLQVPEHALAEHVGAEAPHRAQARPREGEARPPQRALPRECGGEHGGDDLLGDDRPRAGAVDSRCDRGNASGQPGDHRQHLDAPEVHVAQHQVLLRGPERADHEREREHQQQRLSRPAAP